jgi:putative ABC transport system substrate-binding protein
LDGLKALDPGVDLIWMLPDPYLLSDMGQEALFLFSLEKKIPVMTFAPRYLKDGAVLVVGFDVRAMGREVAGLVRKFLNGTPVSELAPVKTRQIKTKINEKIAAKFGLKINHGDKP